VSTAKLERTLIEIAKLPQAAMEDACKQVEKIARDVGSSVGPIHFRKRSGKLTAITRIKGRGKTTAEATVYGVPTGPWVWVTSGTSGHTIPRQRSRGNRKVRYLKGVKYGHPYGKPVHHPGASGKGAWKRVVTRAEVEVPKAFVDAARRVMGRG
jgi:hypothetical protein